MPQEEIAGGVQYILGVKELLYPIMTVHIVVAYNSLSKIRADCIEVRSTSLQSSSHLNCLGSHLIKLNQLLFIVLFE